MVVCPDRTRNMLFVFMKRFTLLGLIMVSNKFSSYVTIEDIEGYFFEHNSANHSETFVNTTILLDTNAIEGTWIGLKQKRTTT
jgi:hypothetical protein